MNFLKKVFRRGNETKKQEEEKELPPKLVDISTLDFSQTDSDLMGEIMDSFSRVSSQNISNDSIEHSPDLYRMVEYADSILF